jgi:hypothetical protein
LHELNVLPPRQANQSRINEIYEELRESRGKICLLLADIWPGGGRSHLGNEPVTASAS